MVRGVACSTSTHYAKLLGFLAELSAAGFFDECFKGLDSNMELYPEDKPKLVYAMGVLSQLMKHADGWQLVPYIDGGPITRLDGMRKTVHDNPLYMPMYPGTLPPNTFTNAALDRLPETLTMPGCYYSLVPELQTKGLEMPKQTFIDLFNEAIDMDGILNKVTLVDVSPREYSSTFTSSCTCDKPIQTKLPKEEHRATHFDRLSSKYESSDAYRFVQGVPIPETMPTYWSTTAIGELLGAIKQNCVAHHFQDLTCMPAIWSDLHTHDDGTNRIIAYASNSDKTKACWSKVTPKIRKGVTPRWFAYVSQSRQSSGDKFPTVWQTIRPFFAVANEAAVDFVLSPECKTNNIPWSCNVPYPELATHKPWRVCRGSGLITGAAQVCQPSGLKEWVSEFLL